MDLKAIEFIDFYKSGHIFQYPDKTELVYSNFTPRSDRLAAHVSAAWDHKVVFLGLQGVIQWLLIDMFNDTFFNIPKEEAVGSYRDIMDECLGAGAVPVDHIAALHDLGYLPILIKALPEGSRVNIGVPVYTIRNTLPEFFWLTNYLESVLSAESWKVITNATVAYEYRRMFEHYAELTGSPKEFCLWQGHDFSFRGMSGVYDAAQTGIGHLSSFYGTDTVPAIRYVKRYYGGNGTFIGGSVPATEHSVMCMGGNEAEIETFRRLIEDVYPSGFISIVSDTWNFWEVLGHDQSYAAKLKDKILARKPNALGLAKVVFRPDSGDPVDILCGEDVCDYTTSAKSFEEALELAKLDAGRISYDQVNLEFSKYLQGTLLLPPSMAYKFRYNSGWYVVHLGFSWELRGNQAYNQSSTKVIKVDEIVATPEMKGAVECLWDIFGGTVTDKGFKVLHERVGLIYGDSITLARGKAIMERLMTKGFASCNWVAGIGLIMAPSH